MHSIWKHPNSHKVIFSFDVNELRDQGTAAGTTLGCLTLSPEIDANISQIIEKLEALRIN